MANQQELRPTSTPVEPRLCPNCGTSATLFNELGVYWWFHCETCSWSQDDVIDLGPEDHQPLAMPCVLADDDPDCDYVRYISGLEMY